MSSSAGLHCSDTGIRTTTDTEDDAIMQAQSLVLVPPLSLLLLGLLEDGLQLLYSTFLGIYVRLRLAVDWWAAVSVSMEARQGLSEYAYLPSLAFRS